MRKRLLFVLIITGLSHQVLYGQTTSPVKFTEEETTWLNEHQTLRLGVDPDWPPFEFIGEGDVYQGMCSDVVKLMRQRLNGFLEVMPNLSSWAEVIQKAKARELDILPCATETPERSKFLNFTDPHLSFPVVVIALDNAPFISGLHDLYGKKVAVLRNYATHELLERDYPDVELVLFETALEALEAVSTGKVEAFVDNLVTASYLIKKHFFTNLKVAATTPHKFALAFGVRKDWPQLVTILDKQLQTITQPEYNAIYQKWISIRYEHGVDMAAIWRTAFKIGAVVLLLLAFVLYWNRRLTKEIVRRKQVEEELRKLSRAVEQSPNTMLITDLEGTIEFVNPAFSIITGYSYDEAIGNNPRLLKSGEHPLQFYEELWNTIRNGEVWQGEFINRRKNGEHYWELSTISPVREPAGEMTHYLAISEDITQRKQTEDSLRAEEFKNKELQQIDKLKDEFLANTSHELRTPLNGIIGLAESLIDGATGELTDKTKTNLAMIVGSGKRLSSLVNDILDFSKLKHHNLELQLKPIGLREITEIVLTLSQPLVLNKPVQLMNTISADLPPAQADENRLQQILHNLMGNAIKFTESGTVEVSAKVINSQLEITISDTGIGIEENKLERIFESFEQAEGSTAREYGGTGLGLAVTKQLIQLHGGNIWVKSTVGQGSQFFLTLPIAEGESSQLSVETSSLSKVQAISPIEVNRLITSTADEVKTTSEAQFHILIVDDEPVNLQVLNNYLFLQDYHIIQATSGQEALTFIEDGFKPDAILLDVMMPKMTGYEVTQKIREQWQADEVPILLLTAKNQVADLVVGLESGANDYLTKPIAKDELLARLKTHLQLKELKKEALCLALENERMKTELEVTQRLQQMLLPREEELEQIPNLDIAGSMEPADEIGGDYYDVLQHNGRILIGIGDATGHGLESGMLMVMAQVAVRTLLENEEKDAVKFLNSINGMIYKNVQERMEVDKNLTLSLLEYKPLSEGEKGGILQVSGNHEDIIVVRNGNLERIDTSELGFQVGFVDDIAEFVNQIEVPLKVGDVVVLYTDGITEAENNEKTVYGIDRLCEVVQQNWQKSVTDIRQTVIDDVRQYIGEHKVFDDITLVVLKQR